MIGTQHKGEIITTNNVEPEEGERTLLCCNKGDKRSPSLDFLDTSADNVTEDMILDYLASIISEIYLQEIHGKPEDETGSRLLQSFNKRTS